MMTTKRPLDEMSSNDSKPAKVGHWAKGLIASMNDPQEIVQQDELAVVIKDKYPKAEHHYLVLSKENISSVYTLTSQHIELLEHMIRVAEKLAAEYDDHHFRLGFHASPSMERLHLHVISDDLNSECLKTKKHWNSFTTNFFIPANLILEDLKKNGKVDAAMLKSLASKYMDQPLKCNKCSFKPPNMPKLKLHLKSHLKSHPKPHPKPQQ